MVTRDEQKWKEPQAAEIRKTFFEILERLCMVSLDSEARWPELMLLSMKVRNN